MKKLLFLATCLFFFSCEKNTRNSETHSTETHSTDTKTTESVEKGAGTEISPQLEGLEDSASRLKVDTISTAEDAQKRK